MHVAIGGGRWQAAFNIDSARPTSGGLIDNSSPYQPTDLCSAAFNGKTDFTHDPPGCTSIGGSVGYNQRDASAKMSPPSNLNRVCPANGPCIDSVPIGNFLIGAGGGLYLGSRHAGAFIEFDLIAPASDQFSLLFNVYVGPQFIF